MAAAREEGAAEPVLAVLAVLVVVVERKGAPHIVKVVPGEDGTLKRGSRSRAGEGATQ